MAGEAFLDAGYAIALAAPSDQLHARALAIADELEASGRNIVTTQAILLEIGNALSKRRYRAAAVQLLASLTADPTVEVIPLSDGLYAEAFRLFQARPDKQWSLCDCVSFVVMELRGLHDALSADEHFEQAGLQDDRTVKRVYQGVPEMLVLVDSSHVTGEYMRSATKILPEEGPAVLALSFNREGSLLLDKIAGDGGPPPSEETPRYLGLLLDEQLIGGCSIRGPVGKDIPISGQTMNEDEVDSLISVFNAGLLPYPLREVTNPAAE